VGFQNLDKFLPFFKTLMIMTKKVGKRILNDEGFQNLDKFLPFFKTLMFMTKKLEKRY
jgi:hypothetical protein